MLENMYMPSFRKETGKNGQQVAAVRYWITESFKRCFQNGWILPERIKWLFYEWFSESVIHPSQRFGFRFEHKRKHHIVAHRLDNHWEIAVICFAPATIVLMWEFRTRKRDERVKRASAYERERETSEQPQNPSSGRSFRHYDIKRLYTHHTTQSYSKRHLANMYSVNLNMHASILNSAASRAFNNILGMNRYYRLKNAMAPRVFLSLVSRYYLSTGISCNPSTYTLMIIYTVLIYL